MNIKDIVELVVGVMAIISAGAFLARAFFRLDAIKDYLDKEVTPHLKDRDMHLERTTIARIERRFDLVELAVDSLDKEIADVNRSIVQTHGRLDTVTAQLGILIQRDTKP